VVEVPVDHGHPDSAWSTIRKTVFGWSDQRFPFMTKTGHKLRLNRKPVVRVVGKAFYDAKHGKKTTPNRRRDKPNLTVWEIHPVMRLEVVEPGRQVWKKFTEEHTAEINEEDTPENVKRVKNVPAEEWEEGEI
jgi:hypothetical protein